LIIQAWPTAQKEKEVTTLETDVAFGSQAEVAHPEWHVRFTLDTVAKVESCTGLHFW
jgi:hypothetical protein